MQSTPTDRSAATSPTSDLTPRAARALVAAVIAALATLALAETGARWLRHRDPVAHSYEAPRNPHFRRDWVRYTAPRPHPEDSRLIIVIGNSQGYLGEESDGALAWPKQLEAGLRRAGINVIVANWAVPAGNSAEMILLAARSASHEPDLVVVSGGARTFISPNRARRPLTYWGSDTTTLAYMPSVRRLLPQTFLERTHARNVQSALRTWSAASWLRSRHVLRERGAWRPPRRPRKWQSIPKFRVGEASEAVARIQLRELAEVLHRGSPKTKLLVVQMPLARAALSPMGRQKAHTTSRVAAELFADHDWIRVADALELVLNEHFRSATHMYPDGHEMYARWLETQVRQLLNH